MASLSSSADAAVATAAPPAAPTWRQLAAEAARWRGSEAAAAGFLVLLVHRDGGRSARGDAGSPARGRRHHKPQRRAGVRRRPQPLKKAGAESQRRAAGTAGHSRRQGARPPALSRPRQPPLTRADDSSTNSEPFAGQRSVASPPRSAGRISSSPCGQQDSTSGGSAHATAAGTTPCAAGRSTACTSPRKRWLPSDTFCSGRRCPPPRLRGRP